MHKIYLIPGLGADQRVFQKLKLQGSCENVAWIRPDPRESLSSYCRRLIEENNIQKGQVIIGVSFGGIIAMEVARQRKASQTIIISSVKSLKEMPSLFRLVGLLGLHKILPYTLFKKPFFILRYAFGPVSGSDYTLLKDIVRRTDLHFLKWAITSIVTWKPEEKAPNLVHIHGTKDRIFSAASLTDYLPIKGGGHFMVLNKAEEISRLIKEVMEG